MEQKRPSIEELEQILNREDEEAITILPNGAVVSTNPDEIVQAWRHFGLEPPKKKPLTMRENLGGEYAA